MQMNDINNIRQVKAELRQYFKNQRNALPADKKKQLDEQILARLMKTTIFQKAQKIGVYNSFGTEVNTQNLIASALALKKQIFLPAVVERDLEFRHFKINKTKLTTGPYGIKQPAAGSKVINKEELDLIIVPGLAFDFHLNRLGYGGGYYDRYLAGLKSFKLALAYDFQIVKQLPVTRSDIKVDAILTEKKVIGQI